MKLTEGLNQRNEENNMNYLFSRNGPHCDQLITLFPKSKSKSNTLKYGIIYYLYIFIGKKITSYMKIMSSEENEIRKASSIIRIHPV